MTTGTQPGLSAVEPTRLTMLDGRRVNVRALEPRDREGLAAAVDRLSEQTR